MADSSKIEWTDATWNPVTGCTEVSPGCDRCYAKTLAERFRGTPGHYFEQGFDVVLRPERLDQPLRWQKPRRIFVNSMSDLFHANIPDEYIADVWAVMSMASQYTFQVLTKRHGRMRSLLQSPLFKLMVNAARLKRGVSVLPDSRRPDGTHAWPLANVWLGVSVEDQQRAELRIPALLETPAAVRFLSCEPLLGPVTFRWAKWVPWVNADHLDGLDGIDWVIVGGESGHGARPMSPDWVRALRDQCTTVGVAFHFKQWGAGSIWTDRQGDQWTLGGDGLLHTPETAPFPREHVEKKWGPLRPFGKAAAGRELDGRTWDEFPSYEPSA